MGYKRRLRKKLVSGSNIMRVFGSSYKYKEEAKELRASIRGTPSNKKNRKNRFAPIKTEHSVRAISTPFGGLNKRY